jgi:hypothetical protein
MSSTFPLPPREQLYNRYCSNKHTPGSGPAGPVLRPRPCAQSSVPQCPGSLIRWARATGTHCQRPRQPTRSLVSGGQTSPQTSRIVVSLAHVLLVSRASTVFPPREQLGQRSCSHKQQHAGDSADVGVRACVDTVECFFVSSRAKPLTGPMRRVLKCTVF